MLSARFRGEGRIELSQAALPSPSAGEVRVRVAACCLCGSELRQWQAGWPVTPGHEIAGVVDQPGHPRHGARVAIYIPVFCDACDDCATGQTHLCRNASDLIGWQRPGGYAEALNVPERCLLPLPDDVPTDLAPLLLDTIGTAAHAVRLARRVIGAGRALVLGAGPVGLGAILALRRLGFPDVDVIEPTAHRSAFAQDFGARVVKPETLAARYAVIIEASGKAQARQLALETIAPLGAVVQVGEAERWDVEETRAIRRKDFFYIRSFYFPKGEYEDNLALFRADRAIYARFVDASSGLQGLPELFNDFSSGRRIKPAVILPH